jgi:hypothetical protein
MPDQPAIDSRRLEVLQDHVLKQCDFVLLAANDLVTANETIHQLHERLRELPPREERERLEPWHLRSDYSMRMLLVCAGNVHKALWPDPKRNPQRVAERKELRESLDVTEMPLLRLAKDFRNDFEHWDERIEEGLEGGPFRLHLHFMMGTLQLTLSGRTLDLAGLVDEVRQLRDKAREVGVSGRIRDHQRQIEALMKRRGGE